MRRVEARRVVLFHRIVVVLEYVGQAHGADLEAPAYTIGIEQPGVARMGEDVRAQTADRRFLHGHNHFVSPHQPIDQSGVERLGEAQVGDGGLDVVAVERDVVRVRRGAAVVADRVHAGKVHINEQTVDDEPNIPFGGVLSSGTGARFGGASNLEAFTDTRWVTIRGDITPYPF